MDNRDKKKRGEVGKKLFLGFLSVVALVALFGALWWNTLNAEPEVRIPTPALPSPNAFTYYLQAGNALTTVTVNGKPIDLKATFWRRGGGHIYSPVQEAALVKANAPALTLLQQGFAYEYRHPPLHSFDALVPEYGKFRALARLLILKAQTKAAAHDWNGAINSDFDAIRLGVDIARGGGLLGVMSGATCQAFGHKDAAAAVDHLNAIQTRATARRLEAIIARHVPFTDVLDDEKCWYQASLIDMFHKPNWREDWSSNGEDEDTRQRFEHLKTLFSYYLINKRQVMFNYTHFMDQWIAIAGQPYARNLPPPAIPDDPINQTLCYDFSKPWQSDVKYQSQNAVLALTLALRAYRLEHNHYPSRLQELIPRYLYKLPEDPMALKGTFGYQRNRNKYVLYSNSAVTGNNGSTTR